jgi:hypothetical protein
LNNEVALSKYNINVRFEKLHNLYSSPNIIRMIKSRRIRGAGHLARMEEKRNP